MTIVIEEIPIIVKMATLKIIGIVDKRELCMPQLFLGYSVKKTLCILSLFVENV